MVPLFIFAQKKDVMTVVTSADIATQVIDLVFVYVSAYLDVQKYSKQKEIIYKTRRVKL